MTDPQARLDAIFASLAVQAPTALDRAAGLYDAKQIYEQLNPRARRGGDRRSTVFRTRDQSENISFGTLAARRLGLTERAVFLDVQLAADLGPRLIAALRGSRIADNAAALRLVATFDDDDRAAVLARLSETSFREALIAAGLRRERDAQEQLYQSVVGRFENMTPATLRRLRAALDAELGKRRGAKVVRIA